MKKALFIITFALIFFIWHELQEYKRRFFLQLATSRK